MSKNKLWPLAKTFLFSKDPEQAHAIVMRVLSSPLIKLRPLPKDDLMLKTALMGLEFKNPIGMAAGFDKNAEVVEGLFHLGFGFVEVGTVTPEPQSGNPVPRVFRVNEDQALINRLGFNNMGHAAVHKNLAILRSKYMQLPGIVGVNIGANKDSEDRIKDYVLGVGYFHDVADYLTINISSPNTPGLRDLQEKEALTRLVDAVLNRRAQVLKAGQNLPVCLKIAPDNDPIALEEIINVVNASELDAMIVSNTTVSRPNHHHEIYKQAGGLSGAPLMRKSTEMLRATRLRLNGAKNLIGVGGIVSGHDAVEKMKKGADLVQAYTGFIYHGIGLLNEMKISISDARSAALKADARRGEA